MNIEERNHRIAFLKEQIQITQEEQEAFEAEAGAEKEQWLEGYNEIYMRFEKRIEEYSEELRILMYSNNQ